MYSIFLRTVPAIAALALIAALVIGLLTLQDVGAQEPDPRPTPTPAPPERTTVPPVIPPPGVTVPAPTPAPPDESTLPTATPIPPGGAESGDGPTQRGIGGDVPRITISRNQVWVYEGTRFWFTLTADFAPTSMLYVNVDVTDSGSFLTGTVPSVITISPGTRTSYLILDTDNDAVDEPHGTVTAEIENGSGYLLGSNTSASTRVFDDDDPPVIPKLSIEPFVTPVTEGESVIFTIEADEAPSDPLEIRVSVTQEGVFLTGVLPTRVTMAAGSTTAYYILRTRNDTIDEPNGTVTGYIFDSHNDAYTVDSSADEADVEVLDDDPPAIPEITLERFDESITEGESAYFTVRASPAPESRLVIEVAATDNGDFLEDDIANEIAFDAGDSVIYYIVPTVDDEVDEPDGSVTGWILSGSGYTMGSPFRDTIPVYDNDLPPPPTPSGLQVTFADNDSVSLEWDRLSGASSYRVRHSLSGESDWTYSRESSARTRTISGLINDELYDFEIQARGNGTTYKDALSEWSDTVTGSTPKVFFNGVGGSLRVEETDNFSVIANRLNPHLEYALAVFADRETGVGTRSEDQRAAFARADCSVKVLRIDIQESRQAYIWDLEITGCSEGSARLRTVLYDRTGSADRDRYLTVDRDEVTVRVERRANRPPEITRPTNTNISYAENRTTLVADFNATDRDGDIIRWSLSGVDYNELSIDRNTGVLTFEDPPDFEDPEDSGRNNVYEVTVLVTDNGSPELSDSVEVDIAIINADEPGVVSLSTTSPQVGMDIEARLSEPDGGASNHSWQWERSQGGPPGKTFPAPRESRKLQP